MPLTAHFLNVGEGDCTIIEHASGNLTMVDIDNLKDFDETTKREELEAQNYILTKVMLEASGKPLSALALEASMLAKVRARLEDPLAYLDRHFGDRQIFRMIVTHPDMDHMTGLHVLRDQERIINFWHTGPHEKEFDANSYRFDEEDWKAYEALQHGEGARPIQNRQGATGDFWTADGIGVLAPTPDLERLADERGAPNILSMVLKVTHAGRSILLGGDATEETWQAIHGKVPLADVWILKASHHGRKTGYYQPAVKDMNPYLTITSVGKAEHDATQNYRRYSIGTVSLRRSGSIVVQIDDVGEITWSRNVDERALDRID